MEKECDKHPTDFLGMNPREFVKGIVSTNYVYQKEFFRELNREYKRQSDSDAERDSLKNKCEKRVQLSSGLECLAISCDTVAGFIDEKYGEYNESVKNLNPSKLAEEFGYTNYFYQQKCFELMKNKMPYSFILVIENANKVCKACENYMKNPFK